MARKTYNEKLHAPGDLPKVEDLSAKPEAVRRYGGTKLLVATPMQYDRVMAKIPKGKRWYVAGYEEKQYQPALEEPVP